MIGNCQRAVEWVVRNAASFGGDPARVYLAGRSSGAHLAGCVLVTDRAKRGLPADALKGGFLMSSMYDLHPVVLSSRSKFLHITPEEEVAASPMRHRLASRTVAFNANHFQEDDRLGQADSEIS
jgi:arylformamidase